MTLPIARSLRPRTFSDFHGHSEIVSAIKTILHPLQHQTFLLAGPRGIGKTTLARLIGQFLLCINPSLNHEPCGICSVCEAIQTGQHADFMEIDAASKTKVEEIRDLIHSSYCAPLEGQYRIYLFDEAHMLSGHSFNALLKAFEEPPPHVIYILATTDRHKIIPTVRSRCLSFVLQPPSDLQLEEYLQQYCDSQDISYESEMLKALSQQADHSYRDLLNLTQHALALGQGQLKGETLRTVFAAPPAHYWSDLFIESTQGHSAKVQLMIREGVELLGPEMFVKQLLKELAHQSLFSIQERACLYTELSLIPRLLATHPDPGLLIEMQYLSAFLSYWEKKNEKVSLL